MKLCIIRLPLQQGYRDGLTVRHLDVDVITFASPTYSAHLNEYLYRFVTTSASKLSSAIRLLSATHLDIYIRFFFRSDTFADPIKDFE